MYNAEPKLLSGHRTVFEALRTATDLDTILRESVQHIRTALGFDRAGVYLADHDRRVIQGTWGTDADGNLEDCHDKVFPIESHSGFAQIYRGEIPYWLTEDVGALMGPDSEQAQRGVQHNAVVAMRWQEIITGFIAVDNLLSSRPFGEEVVEPLEAFGAQVALAVYLHAVQQQLVRYERLAALGELANAVRHEVNNPLQGIIGYAELLTRYPQPLPEEVRSMLLIIHEQAQRIRDIVKKLESPLDRPVEVVRGVWMTDLHQQRGQQVNESMGPQGEGAMGK